MTPERSPQFHVTIRPPGRWGGIPVKELWSYKELLYFLVWRDVKVRYKQTAFGASWAVVQPFLMMVVFSIFLGRLGGVPSDGIPYPVFAYAALVPWTLFAQSVSASTLSLVGSANLVSKIYFPRLLLPISATGSYVFDFLIAFGLLVLMMIYYGFTPTIRMLWVPALTALALVAALAVGVFFAALNARYRDVQYAVPFLVQLWLFMSPVAYPSSLVEGPWRLIYGLNPMAGVVEGFRWSLLGGGAAPRLLLALSVGISVVGLLIGLLYFQKVERTFADVI